MVFFCIAFILKRVAIILLDTMWHSPLCIQWGNFKCKMFCFFKRHGGQKHSIPKCFLFPTPPLNLRTPDPWSNMATSATKKSEELFFFFLFFFLRYFYVHFFSILFFNKRLKTKLVSCLFLSLLPVIATVYIYACTYSMTCGVWFFFFF